MKPILLLSMPGTTELLIIAGVVILLFGAKKIPDLMKGLGTGISEFKKARNESDREVRKKEKE